ncbi:MAG TPA: lysophospholipase [Polyangiaceae bacterium]|jgi:alpha-beta hydrolase superfamily lysophospholipase|nr:lysophospholipase [Polyangiaceae bacterium]
MSVRRDEGKLTRRKTSGPSLYFNVTVPEAPPQVVVALLHGYADYGARYAHVMDAWAARGIVTVAIDMRGHGHAEGPRGSCLHFSEYLDDVAELAALVEERAAGLPRILFGHSFGGLVAATAAIADPGVLRGLVLSSPFFGVGLPVPKAQRLAGKVVSRLVPSIGMPSGLHGRDITHDAARARAYDEDPLVFKNANSRWFNETEVAQAAAIDRAPMLKMPLYTFIGTGDRVVKIERAREFFDAAGSSDKTWVPYEGLFHETLNEIDWQPIAGAVADWVLAHK